VSLDGVARPARADRGAAVDNPRFQRLSPDDRVIVSEPFSDLPGVWQEIPEATAVTVRRGGVLKEQPFRPQRA
jgi:predicted glutamine amidotransferase